EVVGSKTQICGRTVRIREGVALVDLRIDPQFGPLPQPQAGIERDVDGLAALAAAGKAIGALVGRSHSWIRLPDERGLPVYVEAILRRREHERCVVDRL